MSSYQDWPWRRITGILGIIFFVSYTIRLVGIVLPFQHDANDSIADIREFFADDDTVIHIGNWILVVTMVFVFLPFAAGLRSVLSERMSMAECGRGVCTEPRWPWSPWPALGRGFSGR